MEPLIKWSQISKTRVLSRTNECVMILGKYTDAMLIESPVIIKSFNILHEYENERNTLITLKAKNFHHVPSLLYWNNKAMVIVINHTIGYSLNQYPPISSGDMSIVEINDFVATKVKSIELLIKIVKVYMELTLLKIHHKNINSSNILVDANDTIKLVDFTAACTESLAVNRFIDYCDENGANDYYLPYDTKVNIQSIDIYSLGVVFYEFLTGTKAFSSDKAIRDEQKKDTLDTLTETIYLPTALSLLILRMVSHDYKFRPNLTETYKILTDFRDGKE